MEVFALIGLVLFYLFLKSDFRKINIRLDKIQKNLDSIASAKNPVLRTAEPVLKKPIKKLPEVGLPEVLPPKEIPKESEQPHVKVKPQTLNSPVIRQKPLIQKQKPQKPIRTISERLGIENGDWEKFIGENIAGFLGIGILVLGIGFLVKFGIAQNWINEYARVAIGVISGGLLLGTGHRFREKISSFSSLLIGGGFAVEYTTLTIAYQYYELFPNQTIPFIILVVLTAFAVFLSYAYNNEVLAIIAMIGGFATPFLVSSGSGNYVALFTYIFILNSAILALSYLKNWKILNFISFLFTALIFGAWLVSEVVIADKPLATGGFLFVSAYYVQFYVINLLQEFKKDNRHAWVDYSTLIMSSFLYLGAGIYLLEKLELSQFRGLFSVALGASNLGVAFLIKQRKEGDEIKNFLFLVLGLVAVFATIAIPLQFKGSFITLFWACELVLLLWLSQKASLKVFEYGFVILASLTMVSFLWDVSTCLQEGEQGYWIIANKYFLPNLCVASAFIFSRYLVKQKGGELLSIGTDIWGSILTSLFILVIFLTGLTEVILQCQEFDFGIETTNLMVIQYHVLFCMGLWVFQSVTKSEALFWPVFAFSLLVVLLSSLIGSVQLESIIQEIAYQEVNSEGSWGTFRKMLLLAPILFTAFLVILSSIKFFQNDSAHGSQIGSTIYWGISLLCLMTLSILIYYSIHMINLGVDYSYSANSDIALRIAFPVLWGLFSFILMAIGLRLDQKLLRIIAIAIMVITLIKLFLFDLRDISDLGKVIAFVVLGIILITVSFLYKKLQALILEGTKSDIIKDDLEKKDTFENEEKDDSK